MANTLETFKERANVLEARVGKNVGKHRRAAELSQKQLSTAMGCDIHTLRMLEYSRRNLRLSEAVILCGILGCALGDLVASNGEQLDLPETVDAA